MFKKNHKEFSSKKFKVNKTEKRADASGYFLAQIKHNNDQNSFKNGSLVLVTHEIEGEKYSVKAKLKYIKDDELDTDTVRLDQKIRMAIGATKINESKVLIQKVDNNFERKYSDRFFGKQTNILRVKRASFNDMEIPICCIEKRVMKTIGVVEGDKIFVEGPQKRIEIQVLELSPKMIESRLELMKRKGDDYYVKTKHGEVFFKNRNTSQDLPWIFMDYDTRMELDIQPYDPVLVYRSNSFAIKKKLHQTTLPLIAMIVGFILGLDIVFPDDQAFTIDILKIAIFSIGIIATIWLNLVSLKTNLK